MTRYVSQRLGALAAAAAFAAGLSPNAVTLLGLVTALLGCVPFVLGDGIAPWVGTALLWQLAFALDCADGQLARATGRSSRYGAWLDVACDHGRQSALAMSVFAVIASHAALSVAALATFLFAAGMSVYLHTATQMHTLKPPDFSAGGSVSRPRMAMQTMLDTPMLLLALCILRPWPVLLAAFAAVYGALLIGRAAAIGSRRLGA